MSNATADHPRKRQAPGKQKAAAAAQTARRICPLDAASQRRRRDQKRQKAVRTGGATTDGFLRTVFLPKGSAGASLQDGSGAGERERDFYQSLSYLASHYQIDPIQSRSYSYPYNSALALWDAEKQLRRKVRDFSRLNLEQQEGGRILLTVEERCKTGATLFYIPIVPLFSMLRDKGRKDNALLLLSVCAYLFQIAGIPYYGQQSSYLHWVYEMLDEWFAFDQEDEDLNAYQRELSQAACIGAIMEQKLSNPGNLRVFAARLQGLNIRNEFDLTCGQLGADALALYRQYPDANLFRNVEPLSQENEDEQQLLSMDRYISFLAKNTGPLFESLSDTVNNEFGEYVNVQEPILIKTFNGAGVTAANLDFEHRLFAVIEQLCDLLTNS